MQKLLLTKLWHDIELGKIYQGLKVVIEHTEIFGHIFICKQTNGNYVKDLTQID